MIMKPPRGICTERPEYTITLEGINDKGNDTERICSSPFCSTVLSRYAPSERDLCRSCHERETELHLQREANAAKEKELARRERNRILQRNRYVPVSQRLTNADIARHCIEDREEVLCV